MGMDKIDVVIPLAKTSIYNDIELRYCLRSIEKHLKNYRDIVIVGDYKPSWMKNFMFLQSPYDFNSISYDIAYKISKACQDDYVTREIIVFNDDYFLTKDIDALTYPYYYKNNLREELYLTSETNYYRQYVVATQLYMQENELSDYNFDTHVPIRIEKDAFLRIVKYFTNNPYLLVRSTYCNLYEIAGTLHEDPKIHKRIVLGELQKFLQNKSCFSVADAALSNGFFPHQKSSILNYLKESFPVKSKYEI